MRRAIIAAVVLVSCLLLLGFRSLFIPAIFLGAAALCLAMWQGAKLAFQKDIQRVFDVRRMALFLAALLFAALVAMLWIVILGGLGHGGRASYTVPLKLRLAFLGIVVVPASTVLLIRYYRIASPDRRRAARWHAVAVALALACLFLITIAQLAGFPPIMYAARTGRRDLEKRLIAMGVDVNVRDRYGGDWDPLTYAAWSGDEEMVGLLLDAGARVYDDRNNDWPALVHASIRGHAGIVGRLIQKTDQPEARTIALCHASYAGRPEVVRLLLDAGADMKAKGRFGRTALEDACAGGQVAVIRLLLERSPADIPLLPGCGRALVNAALQGDLGMLRLLLSKGVDVNDWSDDLRSTALMIAAQKGSADVVSFLLENGADPNVTTQAGDKSALRRAVEAGHDDVRDLLTRYGARE